MADLSQATLASREIGAAPLLEAMMQRLQLEEILAAHLPSKRRGRKTELPPARTLRVMISNVLLSRRALYAVPAWLAGFVPEHFGLDAGAERLFNDDRIGRTLDLLFDADQAPLVTAVVLKALQAFDIDMSQLHNDSTSVTFRGSYNGSTRDDDAPHITFGFNKDHRPDLKQLVYSLTISADGAVPIHFKTYPGNRTDDTTHLETWTTLCQLVGSSRFLYVADSKLCVSATMKHIDQRGGSFLTVLPATRAEEAWFKTEYLPKHLIDWREVRRDRNRLAKHEPDNVYEGFESPQRSKEGFRVLWYKSSAKLNEDQDRRFARIAAARVKLDLLQSRRRRGKLKTIAQAQREAEKILADLNVADYLEVRAVRREFDEFVQIGPGRPGPATQYERLPVEFILFDITEDHQAIKAAALSDGMFPLITNDDTMSLEEALAKYKYQPFLEKRNEQLKSVLAVAPVFLKRPERVASLLCVYFLALLVYALLEREIRRRMKEKHIASLPLYPEDRLCAAPTADLVLAAFAGLRRHHLLDADGQLLRVFHDPLPSVCQSVLELLAIDPAIYGHHA
jgi:transposase